MATKAFFIRRLNDHIQYLKKINATLDGQGEFRGTDCRECRLGLWLYGEGRQEVSSLNDPSAAEVFDSLFEPHQKFHDFSHLAVKLQEDGNHAAAQQAMTEMHVLSHTIVNKLLALDGMA